MALPKVDVVRWFEKASKLPLGTRALDRVLWRVVPFNKALKPRVTALVPGEVCAELDLSPGARNHLGSMHAAVLVTIGEYVQGLLILANAGSLGAEVILKSLTIEYTAKAKGTVTARAAMGDDVRSVIKAGLERGENPQVILTSTVTDKETGKVVATLQGTWLARRPR